MADDVVSNHYFSWVFALKEEARDVDGNLPDGYEFPADPYLVSAILTLAEAVTHQLDRIADKKNGRPCVVCRRSDLGCRVSIDGRTVVCFYRERAGEVHKLSGVCTCGATHPQCR